MSEILQELKHINTKRLKKLYTVRFAMNTFYR